MSNQAKKQAGRRRSRAFVQASNAGRVCRLRRSGADYALAEPVSIVGSFSRSRRCAT